MTHNLPKIVFNEEVCPSTYLQSELLFHVWRKHLEKQNYETKSLNISTDGNKEKENEKTLLLQNNIEK